MTILDFGIPELKFNVRVDCSTLYECALDIASFTWDVVHDKLERSSEVLAAMRKRMSDALKREVKLAGEVHTWRSLLNLAHRCPDLHETPLEAHVEVFLHWLRHLGDDVVVYAAPDLGGSAADTLSLALHGDRQAQAELLRVHFDNPVIHPNLQYLFSVSPADLVRHIERLVTLWHKEMFDDISSIIRILQADRDEKRKMAESMDARELIRVVTRGGELRPEPGATTLWLIPQIAYRPLNIRNYVEGAAIYYYPVADDHLPGQVEHAQLTRIANLYKAVGDVQRVRLLKLLRTSPKSLAELAAAINTSKSTTHHHLILLRSAGLVRVKSGVYEIDLEAIRHLSDELHDLLQIDE